MSAHKMSCTNPQCARVLGIPDAALGHRVRCPDCGQEIRVPGTLDELRSLSEGPRCRLRVTKGPAFAGTDTVLDPARAYTIGRADTCALQLPGATISRRHFSLHFVNNQWVLEDLNTTTGTMVDGLGVVNKALRGGEVIEVGAYRLTFLAPGQHTDGARAAQQVVLPSGDAAPLPLSESAPPAPPAQPDEDRLAEQSLIEARSFTAYTPEHLEQASARDRKRYTMLLTLKLVGALAIASALTVALAWYRSNGASKAGQQSALDALGADSDKAAAPIPSLPNEFVAALERQDFELAGKLLETGSYAEPVRRAMRSRLESDMAAFRGDLLRRAADAVRGENWTEAGAFLKTAQAPHLGPLPQDWRPVQDALALHAVLAKAKEYIDQGRWEEARKALDGASKLAPADPRIPQLTQAISTARGAGVLVSLSPAVDGAIAKLNDKEIKLAQELWGLEGGAAQLRVQAPGFLPARQSLVLEPGRLLTVNVRLLRAASPALWAALGLRRAGLNEALWVAARYYGRSGALRDTMVSQFVAEAEGRLGRRPGQPTLRVSRITLKSGETLIGRVWTDAAGKLGINRLPAGGSQILASTEIKAMEDLDLPSAAAAVIEGLAGSRKAGQPSLETLKQIAGLWVDMGARNQELAAATCADLVGQCLPSVEGSCGRCAGAARVTCATCKGAGLVTQHVVCDRCKGAKEVDCYDCGGKGKRNCSACAGRGTVQGTERYQTSCSNCNGSGHVRGERCRSCGGTGQSWSTRTVTKQCTACTGSGSVACQRCNSTGQLTCPKCKGAGEVGDRVDCPDCDKGTALCPCCKGAGTKEGMVEARRQEMEEEAVKAAAEDR